MAATVAYRASAALNFPTGVRAGSSNDCPLQNSNRVPSFAMREANASHRARSSSDCEALYATMSACLVTARAPPVRRFDTLRSRLLPPVRASSA
jgi:hypothetical protein